MKKLSPLLALLALVFLFLLPLARAVDTTEGLPPGTALTLEASSDGTPVPTFEWFKDGAKIADGKTLIIASIAAVNAGRYTVRATNEAGSANSEGYVLQVYVAPSPPTIKITAKRPADVTVSVPFGTKVVTQPPAAK